ncbi:MAG: hypothetical protein L0Y64_01325, partial [Myxococcaceae bacterium]|nr:hypothetical protein [Myxococcaceae bacterium]
VGFQGDGVAYGYRTYRLSDVRIPEVENTLLALDGLSFSVAGGNGEASLLAWTNPQVTERPGAVKIPGGSQQLFLRDLFITKDLAELHSLRLALESLPRARLNIAVQEQGGAPVEGAWISVISPADGRILTVAVTDGLGAGRVDLEPRGYRLVARVPGQGREASRDVDVASSGAQAVTLTLPAQ